MKTMTMKTIWEKKMTEYHLRKKYNLEKDQKIIITNNHYFYEGLLLQEIKQCKKTCVLNCRKTHMKYQKFFYEIIL